MSISFQNKIRAEPSVIMGGGDTDMAAKLLHLETEVTAKKGEITALREQVGCSKHSCICYILYASFIKIFSYVSCSWKKYHMSPRTHIELISHMHAA